MDGYCVRSTQKNKKHNKLNYINLILKFLVIGKINVVSLRGIFFHWRQQQQQQFLFTMSINNNLS